MAAIRKYVKQLLRKLVEINTSNPPGLNYEIMAETLREELENLGLNVRLIEVPEKYLDKHYPCRPLHKGLRRVIVYACTGGGEPIIHFNCHYDVVPPGQGWSVNPFKLTIKHGKAYGRGTSDMKGGVTAVIATLKSLVEKNIIDERRGAIEAVFVPDEEAGGVGTKYLVENVLKVKPRYVIIPEPTSLRNIIIGHKGVIKGT